MNDIAKPPSPEAKAVVAAWPGDEWLTEHEVLELLSDQFATRRPHAVLNEARRRSWLIRRQRTQPTLWKRTPTGAQAARGGDRA